MKKIDYIALIVSLIAGVVLLILYQCHWDTLLLICWIILWAVITLGLTNLKRKYKALVHELEE